MKSIYTYYKDRLIEISGRNRCICLKNLNRRSGYDLGRLFENNLEMGKEFISFLFADKKEPFVILDKSVAQKANYDKPLLNRDIQYLRAINRDIEEIEKETGRYELYVGYPFVVGTVKDLVMKGPLLLFPVKIEFIDEFTVALVKKSGVTLNKALIYAYANLKRLKLEELETELTLGKEPAKSVLSVIKYLRTFGFKFDFTGGFLSYDKLDTINAPEIRELFTLGRYTMANSVYADYAELQKKRLTNEAIDQLLNIKPVKISKKKNKSVDAHVYASHHSDFAQSNVISEISVKGNMVVYGPPGTGKSQTIVNIISDAVLKNKRVLVVSQKKAALDVVYNRLGEFGAKAMYINDAEKEKKSFYDKCFDRHQSIVRGDDSLKNIEALDASIDRCKLELEKTSALLNTKTDFGLTPSQMYALSYMIGKDSDEYAIYTKMLKGKILKLRYDELSEAVSSLLSGKAQLYYDFSESKKKNPCIDFLKTDLDIYTISQAKTGLNELLLREPPLFNKNKYPYARQLLAYMGEFHSDDYSPLIKMTAKLTHPKAYKARTASYALLPMLPITLSKTAKIESELEKDFAATKQAIDEYLINYAFLKNILSVDGYFTLADHLISGNTSILKMLLSALDEYVNNRDICTAIGNLAPAQKTVLEFAYSGADSLQKFLDIIKKVPNVRIYHELLVFEEKNKDVLHKLTEYDSLRRDILRYNALKSEEVKKVALKKFDNEYLDFFENSTAAKDYLYQISKKQNYWSIRKTTEVYGDFLFRLFPCWLLSPENVSTILPLKMNLFDLILFDEASQIFIENTLPAVFRGKRIVVAGDAKQLRPTSTFMKRYMGGDPDENDYSTQAALEVESLLDLAVSRYDSCNLTYHYRSRYEELIDFSSRAFYSNKLQISPNIERGKLRPIERIKVNGKWIDRCNLAEAEKVVELVKKLFRVRKNNETIGIITFNAEQESAIEDIIDRECFRDEKFRSYIIKERSRKENGEDVSLFVKNIENVQGDERDIIIFSIGYAYNEAGKMVTNFGSLSVEGGENRLNVLITRAKKKIYVVTSIEPEDLKTDSKNLGPKLFRKYLEYARAVSDGNQKEIKLILDSLSEIETPPLAQSQPIEIQIGTELEKLGYKTEIGLGNSKVRISLAVYDATGRYLVGVQTEADAMRSSESVLERDVYVPEFLESKGWNFMRVWNRDWWMSPQNVVNEIVAKAQKAMGLSEAAATSAPDIEIDLTPPPAEPEIIPEVAAPASPKSKAKTKKAESAAASEATPKKASKPAAKTAEKSSGTAKKTKNSSKKDTKSTAKKSAAKSSAKSTKSSSAKKPSK